MQTIITHSATHSTNKWKQSADITVTITGSEDYQVRSALKALEAVYNETREILLRYGQPKV